MARIIKISEKKELRRLLTRTLQSGNINFLIGSGASTPAIKVSANIEKEIQDLFEAGNEDEANKKIHLFLSSLQMPNNFLIKEKKQSELSPENQVKLTECNQTLECYTSFLQAVENVLVERNNNLLPRQANIFTTNYDLYLEKAATFFPVLKLNDGFTRTPSLDSKQIFSSQSFFNSTYNKGNLYNYRVEIPAINLIKLHGSLSWKRENEQIIFQSEEKTPPPNSAPVGDILKYNQSYSVILPRKSKFRETIMDRTYYDLLRIYANELDKETSLLLTFGFSFLDEHIFDITARSLKNPTLKVVIVAYSEAGTKRLEEKFRGFRNVTIVSPEQGGNNDFAKLTKLITSVLVENIEDDSEDEDDSE